MNEGILDDLQASKRSRSAKKKNVVKSKKSEKTRWTEKELDELRRLVNGGEEKIEQLNAMEKTIEKNLRKEQREKNITKTLKSLQSDIKVIRESIKNNETVNRQRHFEMSTVNNSNDGDSGGGGDVTTVNNVDDNNGVDDVDQKLPTRRRRVTPSQGIIPSMFQVNPFRNELNPYKNTIGSKKRHTVKSEERPKN